MPRACGLVLALMAAQPGRCVRACERVCERICVRGTLISTCSMGDADVCFINYSGLVRRLIVETDRLWTWVGRGMIPSPSFALQLLGGWFCAL